MTAPHITTPARLTPATAGSVALLAAAVGVTGNLLMHDSAAGLGFTLWIAFAALALVPVVWRAERTIGREAGAWLAVAAVFAIGVCWRDSELLQFADACVALGALLMASVTIKDASTGLFARRLRDTALAIASAAFRSAVGAVPLVVRELLAPTSRATAVTRGQRLARVAIIALPLVLVFGSLLRAADPIFASLVKIPAIDFESIAPHVIITGFLAVIAAGWARHALLPPPETRPSLELAGFRLDIFEVTVALGTLNVLFGMFVLAQIGWLFGGEQFLRERTGLTVAEYARSGFFQLVWIVVLVVPVLVGTRSLLRPGREAARRHSALAYPVVALVGAIMISAALRMRLYVHYYGLSTERFYPSVFMLWLAVVLVWLSLTVLRGWGRPFVGGSVITGLVTLAALNVVVPDGIVARVNVERSLHPAPNTEPGLDLAYLSTLSGEAAGAATDAVLTPSRLIEGTRARGLENTSRCEAAATLLRRWGPTSAALLRTEGNAAWRRWNAGEAAALDVVSRHSAALRTISHGGCAHPSH